MSALTISLLVAVVMAALFLVGKFPYGLVTISCAVILILTGVVSISDAFAGFGNSTVVVMASMFVMTAALQKTNVPYWISGLLNRGKGKSDTVLVASIVFAFVIMIIVIPDTVSIAMVVTFLAVLPKDSRVTATKMVLPLLMLVAGWYMAAPVGMGSTVDFLTSGLMQGAGVGEDMLLNYGDTFRMRIPAAIACVVYVMLIWKKIPDTHAEIDTGSIQTDGPQKSELPKWKEYMVYICFVIVVLGLIFNSYLGDISYVLPAAAACLFGFTGILSKKELILNAASDTIWMMVGVLCVTNAMTSTGATELLGNMLLPLISWTNNGFVIILICGAFSAVMTTFLSNTGTAMVLTPLVSTMALTAGIDPRSLAAAVSICAMYGVCFPSGSVTCALAYGLGQYNPIKTLKYTLPLLILLVVVTAVTISFVYPPFG